MKLQILALALGLVVATSGEVAVAAKAKKIAHKTTARKYAKGKAKAVKSEPSSELQTDVKFDDSVLHGQYQVPEEALAKVENEKALGDLIGVRKHFKDRLTTASEQE
jgi:hypothetical protein